MTSFGTPKHTKEKKLNVHDNILELKAQFKSKLNLIQSLDEQNWIKSMCIKCMMYIFSTTIGLHVYSS
jgi:hypothetical protein